MKDAINDQMKQYAVYSNEIDKIQEHTKDNTLSNDQFDSTAPFTLNIEYQDDYEGVHDLHPDFSENYDLSQDVWIPSVTTSTEPLILNELQDNDYRQLVQILNKKQKVFLSCLASYLNIRQTILIFPL